MGGAASEEEEVEAEATLTITTTATAAAATAPKKGGESRLLLPLPSSTTGTPRQLRSCGS